VLTVDLRGKCAVVTGAAGILGRHFAHGLARCGAQVVAVDVDEKATSALAKELTGKSGVDAIGVSCDITQPDAVRAMVAAAEKRFGGIDILHNNAATKTDDLEAFFAPFEEYSLETWNAVTAVNLTGAFLCAQAVGRSMIRRGKGGSVVQTASIYGVVAPDQRIYEGSEYMGRPINTPAVYSATKAGLLGLTKFLATYWAPHDIRVNAITPGGVQSGQSSTFVTNYSKRVPLGRMGEADDMVNALLYLASDEAKYVTGQNLIVDGGLTAW
jgi:NAD(P)-dependent dehydrogenase (short-subunit alcohol dehydrogenase family)